MSAHDLSRAQVHRSLERLRPHLSPLVFERLQRVAGLISDTTLRTTAATVHQALFADASQEAATKSLQRLRTALSDAAEEAGVVLELRTSEARSVGAERREVWFEGELPPLEGLNRTEELERVGEALIVDVQGKPLGNVEPRVKLNERRDGKPLVKLFISYAHADGDLPHKFIEDLAPRLLNSPKYAFDVWRDIELLPGEDWDATIRGALGESHLGLLLVSTHFFASKYIGHVEIPKFVSGRGVGVEGKRVLPVELEQLDFANTDMRGLAPRQVFRGPKPKTYPFPGRKSAKRTAWMNALVAAIHEILDRYADVDPGPPSPPPGSRSLLAAQMLGPDLDGVERCLIEDTLAHPARLDESLQAPPAEAAPTSVQAVDYIMGWLRDESGPPLFALLGEYGMGKTITCQRVVRAIERGTSEGEILPSPLYFDLRRLTSLRGRDQVPRLNEVIDECIERGWSVLGAKPSAKELLEQADQQPMFFIFDGLDEALVHLSEAHGREFTRELLRVRELGEKTGLRTRVLLSCRTHFFRTLQEQDSHFTGHDRGRTTAKDYAALVLLPLGPEQVRRYLKQALPEIDVERASELVRSVHNLEELAARPYTLQLISEQIPMIEELRARGETVRGVTLYRLMVEKWLNRDGGKHHIKPDHKRKLMSHLAAWTWSRGTRFVPAAQLEDWFGGWLTEDPAMHRRYADVGFEKLEEDLRTATFLVREDDQAGETLGFRFAHTSMQEFFLSCFLFDALVDDVSERWTFKDVSHETWDFFMQHIIERGGGDLVARMSAWAKDPLQEVRWLIFRYVIVGHQRGWPIPSVLGIDLADIQLQGVQLRGPLDLSESCWDRANLRQVQWQNITVNGASFKGADLRFLEWDGVKAVRTSFEHARADGAVFRHVVWDEVKGGGANGRRCSFLHTRPQDFWLEDALVAPRSAAEPVERTLQVDPLSRVLSLAWSPDGTRALLGDHDGTLRLWDVATGVRIGLWEGHRGGVVSCAWSPDGTRALSGGEDGTLQLWDMATGTSVAAWQGHQGSVRLCHWSPDGTRALSGGEDGMVGLWDRATGERLGLWNAHEGGLWSCAWSPDGTLVLSGGEDRLLRLWDVVTGGSVKVLEGAEEAIRSCTFSADGKQALAVDNGGTLREWDLATEASLRVWKERYGMFWPAIYSPDGTRMLLGQFDGSFSLWDVATGVRLEVWEGQGRPIWSCAWSRDGTRVLSVGFEGTLSLWDVSTGTRVGTWDRHWSAIRSCVWSPDGTHALLGGGDGKVWLWNVATGATAGTWQGRGVGVTSCTWSADGARVLSIDYGGRFWLWDMATGESVEGGEQVLREPVWSGDLSPDGKSVLLGREDGTLQLWEVASGSSLGVWKGHQRGIKKCAWSPDGMRVLSGDQNGILGLWDVATGACAGMWEAHKGQVMSCAWSPDGTQALSGGEDGSLRLWHIATGASLGMWRGHRGRVFSCAWSPDGKRALSGGEDGTLRLWVVSTGTNVGVWEGHRGRIWSCAWSPDGRQALSVGEDGTFRLWDIETGISILVLAVLDGRHAIFIPGSQTQGGRVLEASEGAWRWLRWKVKHVDGTTELLPAETFGELPSPRQ